MNILHTLKKSHPFGFLRVNILHTLKKLYPFGYLPKGIENLHSNKHLYIEIIFLVSGSQKRKRGRGEFKKKKKGSGSKNPLEALSVSGDYSLHICNQKQKLRI